MTTPEHTTYAVSLGSYSDYRVLAVFDRREDAEAAIAAGYLADDYDKPEIEEFDHYRAGELPRKTAMIYYFATVNPTTGAIDRAHERPDDEWVHPAASRKAEVTINHPPGRYINLTVRGPAGKRTHKAYTDALAKLRAECVDGMHGSKR